MQGVTFRWSLGYSMLHDALVDKLYPKSRRCLHPCDDGARANRRSLLFLISHLMDALTEREKKDRGSATVGKPQHPLSPALLICLAIRSDRCTYIHSSGSSEICVAFKSEHVILNLREGDPTSHRPFYFKVRRGSSAQRMKPELNYIELKRAPTGRC
jgi:hypothetical protein